MEFMIYLLLMALGILVGGLVARSSEQTARLTRIERKLDALLGHLGVEADGRDVLSAQARAFADAGERVAAIRQHREDTGAGLAEAKAVVDEYLAQAAHRG